MHPALVGVSPTSIGHLALVGVFSNKYWPFLPLLEFSPTSIGPSSPCWSFLQQVLAHLALVGVFSNKLLRQPLLRQPLLEFSPTSYCVSPCRVSPCWSFLQQAIQPLFEFSPTNNFGLQNFLNFDFDNFNHTHQNRF